MDEQNAAGDVYESHIAAEGALKALHDARFDMKSLSIVGKDFRTEEHPIGFYHVADGVMFCGKNASFWGNLWGWLVGAGLFLVPGVGHVIVLGRLVGPVADTLKEAPAVDAAIGAIGAALVSVGIPEGSAARYEAAIRAGKFVITVHGSFAEIGRALQTLANGALQAEVAVGIPA